jgi:ribosomal protein L13
LAARDRQGPSDEVASSCSPFAPQQTQDHYTPHVITGDFIVIINASQLRIVTGAKSIDEIYLRHSSCGITATSFRDMQDKFGRALEKKPSGHAAKGPWAMP